MQLIENRFPSVTVKDLVMTPNHIHAMIFLYEKAEGASPRLAIKETTKGGRSKPLPYHHLKISAYPTPTQYIFSLLRQAKFYTEGISLAACGKFHLPRRMSWAVSEGSYTLGWRTPKVWAVANEKTICDSPFSLFTSVLMRQPKECQTEKMR